MLYLLIFLSSLIFTIFLTPHLIFYLFKIKVVDQPDERKIHAEAVPRMGGIITYALLIFSLTIYYQNLNEIRFLVLGSVIIVVCGILDDVFNIRYRLKFILQAAAALCMLMFFIPQFDTLYLFTAAIPAPLSYILLFVFIIGAINSINLLDGLDGLVSSLALIISILGLAFAYVFNSHLLFIICAALAGSILGFLKFNAFPARIFLGDTGSLVLGYFLVAIALIISLNVRQLNNAMSLTLPIMLLALPLTDTLKVMFVRYRNKKNIFLPDKNHIHHILIDSSIRHKSVVLMLSLFSAAFAIITLYYFFVSRITGMIAFGIFAVLLLIMQYVLVKSKVITMLLARVKNIIIRPTYPLLVFSRVFKPLSLMLVLIYLFSIMPQSSKINFNIIGFVFVSGIVTFAVSMINRKKYQVINDIYILFNILIYILLTRVNAPVENNLVMAGVVPVSFQSSCILILAALVAVFIFAKDSLFPKRENFLSGFDLIITVAVSMAYILIMIVFPQDYHFAANGLLEAFIIYVWYKTMIYLNDKYAVRFYYSSFGLSFFLLLLLVLY